MTLYGYCKEKINVGHYWALKGYRNLESVIIVSDWDNILRIVLEFSVQQWDHNLTLYWHFWFDLNFVSVNKNVIKTLANIQPFWPHTWSVRHNPVPYTCYHGNNRMTIKLFYLTNAMSNRYIFPCQIIDLYKQPINDKHLQWMINAHNASKLWSATLTLF